MATQTQQCNQQIIHHHIIPNLTAALSQYQSEDLFTAYLKEQQIDATVDTWIPSNATARDGNSTNTVSTLLAKLESILDTFLEI